jgi:hypothetical protein
MKTIKKVLDDMRDTAIYYRNDGNESHNAYELLMSFHRDIEEAVKALVADRDNWRKQALAEDARANAATGEKSSQVGNAAVTRKALKHIEKLAREFVLVNYYISEFPKMLLDAIQPALSAPARNCDVYQTKDSLLKAIHDDREYLQSPIKERESVVDFILTEVKGETK